MAFELPIFSAPAGAVPISPGTNIQSVVNSYPTGTAFLLKAGVHRGQTITPRNGTSFYGEVGPDGSLLTILSGEDQTKLAFDWWRGTNVTIRNLVIERYVTGDHVGAIFTNQGWLVEGNEIRNNQKLGIYIHRGRTTVRGNYIHNNGMLGITGSGENILVEDNEISSNNTGSFNSAYQAGGLKFGGSATSGLIIRRNYVHDNNAKGIWTDVNLPGALIEDNLVVRNRDEGIKVEISYGNTVRNNRLADNGRNGGWMYGSQILISTSADSRVYGNTVEVNAAYGKGISIIQQNRGSGPLGPYVTRNNQVYDNRIIYRGDTASQDMFNALSGVAQDISNNSVFTNNNRFYNNQYYFPAGISERRFAWNNTYVDLAAFEAAHGETGSTYSSNLPTLNWNWNNPSLSQRIEAENFDQITGFSREEWVAASGGTTLGLLNGSPSGTATYNFTGLSGLYDIFIGAFDENDGRAQLQLTRNNSSVGSITLNQQLQGGSPSDATRVTRQIGSSIQLNQGDILRVIGTPDSAEYARFDFIQFVPV
jgi:parallel beta-helix repeat protein